MERAPKVEAKEGQAVGESRNITGGGKRMNMATEVGTRQIQEWKARSVWQDHLLRDSAGSLSLNGRFQIMYRQELVTNRF